MAHVMRGQNTLEPMMTAQQATAQAGTRSFLNPAQRQVIQEVLTSHDRIHGLQGLAGSGKTTTLQAIREGAEKSGYKVEGFAPSSKAAGALREAGISANTLQSFLVRGQAKGPADPAERHLYMLDESSLASTKQMRAFRTSAKYQDRPAAADIVFCVAALADGMIEDRIERALEGDYLSRDPALPNELSTSGGRSKRRGDGPSGNCSVAQSALPLFLCLWDQLAALSCYVSNSRHERCS